MIISKNYKIKTQGAEVTSALKSTEDTYNSDLYLDKKFNWFTLNLNVAESIKAETLPILHEKIVEKTKLIYRTNTLNFDLTNVNIDNVYYKYIIKYNGNFNEDTLYLYLNLEDIAYKDGHFYTNTPSSYYEDKNNYAYTDNVLDIDNCKIVYKSKYIEIITPPDYHLIFKKNILTPTILNENSFYIPSFYINLPNSNRLLRCVESDIETFQDKITILENNYFNFKVKNTYNNDISKSLNTLYKISNDIPLVELTKSTHCFSLFYEKQYFLINENSSITLSDNLDGLFSIEKIIDLEKIDLIINNYKYLNNEIHYNEFNNNLILTAFNENQEYNNSMLNYITTDRMYNKYVYLKENQADNGYRYKFIYTNNYDKNVIEHERLNYVNLSENSFNNKYPIHLDTILSKNLIKDEITLDAINYSFNKVRNDNRE